MSSYPQMAFDDIETEASIDVDPSRLIPRFNELYVSIECLGDRFSHGRIYSRQSGRCVGGWASLPPLSPDELTADFMQEARSGWTPDAYRTQTQLDSYHPCTCGVPADDPHAASHDRHKPDCQYRNPTS